MSGPEGARQGKRADLLRFLLAGGLNTLLTLALYQLLLFLVSPQWAYALSWMAGIAFVMIVYPSKVFVEGRSGMRDRAMLGLSYVGIFLVGLATLEVTTHAGLHSRLAIVFVIVATTLTNFVVARLLLRRPRFPTDGP